MGQQSSRSKPLPGCSFPCPSSFPPGLRSPGLPGEARKADWPSAPIRRPVRRIAAKPRSSVRTNQPSLSRWAQVMRMIKPIELLVPVSFTHCCASTPGLSTWWSSTALIGNTRFEAGFPLRCLQRLSVPYIATLLCRWHDNRSTSDTSIPVLSY